MQKPKPITDDEVLAIFNDIVNNKMPIKDVMSKYNISRSRATKIRHMEIEWLKEIKEKYNLDTDIKLDTRPKLNVCIRKIENELQNGMTTEQIAIKYGIPVNKLYKIIRDMNI